MPTRPDAAAPHLSPPARPPVLGPGLDQLLHAIGVDVAYHRAAGCELFHHDDRDRELAVLDLVGGYGSLLLGHHHPQLVAAMTGFLATGRPVHAQGSSRPISQQLAGALDERAGGNYHVLLTNSGSEAIEAAMKHAMLATGGRTFIALENAFHGKTLGALQLAGNAAHREGFELPDLAVRRVELNDVAALEAAFAETDDPAGFIFEPIQGEGGVQPMDRAFANRAAALCRDRGVPMIADECQTGVGRTGRFLACQHLGIQPDYITLSKALGGGLVKIAALLVRRDQYRPAFDQKHSSTFAGDELSSAVALRTLELIDEPLLQQVRDRGRRFRDRLLDLARRYPAVIADVRGRGLMLALQLRPLDRSTSFTLRLLSATDDLALLATGYLLRKHHVRVAPALSAANTLRLQPPAIISDSQIDRALAALEDLCERLQQGDAPALTAHLTRRAEPRQPASLRDRAELCTYRPGKVDAGLTDQPRRVAWLCHMIDDVDLVSLEPRYAACDPSQRQRLLDRLAPLANPVVMSEVDVHSATGERVRLYPILLPVTSAWMKRCLEAGTTDAAAALVQNGVDIARRLNCSLIALGQYTSIVTRNGRRITAPGIGVSTGNTYSLALALQAVTAAESQHAIVASRATCAIVGAAGNIGQTAARLLAQRYRRTLLLGSRRRSSIARLRRLQRGLRGAQVVEDPAMLRAADVVLAATSAVDRPIGPEHIGPHAVVCDLSVPTAVRDDLPVTRPDVTLIKGGIVRLPGEEDLGIVGFPLPPGRTYGCMAEALLLGLARIADRRFTGLVRPEGVELLAHLADRHGFALDQYKHHCVLGTQPREVTHVGAA